MLARPLESVPRHRNASCWRMQVAIVVNVSLDLDSCRWRHVRPALVPSQPSVQQYTNPGRQVAWTTEFCTVAPNVRGSSVWNFPHVTFLVPGILRWLVEVVHSVVEYLGTFLGIRWSGPEDYYTFP